MPLPGQRGGLEPSIVPARFSPNAGGNLRVNAKNWQAYIHVFTNQTVAGDTTSDNYALGRSSGFVVYSKGTGSVKVEVGPHPDAGIWVTAHTLTNEDYYATEDFHPWVRMTIVGGASGMDVWLVKKIESF